MLVDGLWKITHEFIEPSCVRIEFGRILINYCLFCPSIICNFALFNHISSNKSNFIRKAVIFMHNNNDAVHLKRTASFLDIGVRGGEIEPPFLNNLFLPFIVCAVC